MNELLKQISSYHLFNYLLPGCLFAVIASKITHWTLVENQIVLGLFVYYFYGLIISRIGSLLIEPTLKFTKFIRFAAYKDYIAASMTDAKIEVLSESNNMYRTLCSTFCCLLFTKIYEKLCYRLNWHHRLDPILMTGVFLLLLFAYRKQTGYINQRVAMSKSNA